MISNHTPPLPLSSQMTEVTQQTSWENVEEIVCLQYWTKLLKLTPRNCYWLSDFPSYSKKVIVYKSLILFLFPLSPNSRGLCDPVQYKLVDQKCSSLVSQETPSPVGRVEEWSLLSLQEVLGLFAFLKNGSICGRLIVAFPKVGGGPQAPQSRAAHLGGQWRVKNKRVTASDSKAPSGQTGSSICPSHHSTSQPEVCLR